MYLFTPYLQLYNKGRLCDLSLEFSTLDVIWRVLKVQDKRHLLHHCYQAVMDHGHSVSATLADAYMQHCSVVHAPRIVSHPRNAILMGMALGSFLSDAGWYADADRIYSAALQLIRLGEMREPRAEADCAIK